MADEDGIARRALLARGSVGATLVRPLAPSDAASAGADTADRRAAVTVNGRRHAAEGDGRTTLLDCLRDGLGLTGTKKGCDHGQRGACTVLVAPFRAHQLVGAGDDPIPA